MLGRGFTEMANGSRGNDLRLAGAAVITEELSIRPTAIDDVGIGWIRRDVSALARAGGVPVTEDDRAVIAATQDVNAAAILLCAVDVVGELVIDSNVMKRRGRLVEPATPCAATVHAHTRALVAAKDHPLGIAGIDPECVIVV